MINSTTYAAVHQLEPKSLAYPQSRMDTNVMPQPRLYFSIHTPLSVRLSVQKTASRHPREGLLWSRLCFFTRMIFLGIASVPP